MIRVCIVIPVYNHGDPLGRTLAGLERFELPIFVVDDGSDEATMRAIDALSSRFRSQLIRLPRNTGKGGAVMAGLHAAHTAGFSHALQVDADGQHDLDDVPRLVAAAAEHPDALISGQPRYDESAPLSRLLGRRLTSFWVAVEALSLSVPDTMCGFRVYPLASTIALIDSKRLGTRMDFDIEIAVRSHWRDIVIIGVPTTVVYPPGGSSNFHMFRDNARITWLHIRLVCGMLLRSPMLLARRIRAKGRHWSKIGERGGVWGMRFLFACYRLGGRRVFSALLLPVMAYFYLTGSEARAASKAYLRRVAARRRALGIEAEHEPGSFEHFMEFGHAVLDKGAMWAGKFPAESIRFDDPDAFSRVRSHPEGALFIGSHLGNLEVLRAFGEEVQGLKVNALVFTRHSAQFMRMLGEVSPRALDRLIEVDSLGPESVTLLQDKLRSGEHVAIVADRTSVNHRERSVYADFLGEPAPFAEGPFVLAHLLGCRVYFLLCLRAADGYRVIVEEFANPLVLPRDSREAALRENVEKYAGMLEKYCLQAPTQWFNFFDFWNQTERRD